MDLLTELMKAQDTLQNVSFGFNGKEYKFYFRYLTLLEKYRIDELSTSLVTTIAQDGSKTEKHEKQNHLIPIHTIIEKALDENGKKIFSHTNPDDFKTISMMPAALASHVAYQMGKDIFGTLSLKGTDDE